MIPACKQGPKFLIRTKTSKYIQLKKKDYKNLDTFKFTKKEHHFSQSMSILGIFLPGSVSGLKDLTEPDNC